ncbi:unnamed protein product [Ascophyllum nodosum]
MDTSYKWKARRESLHYERDLGVPIDIIDPRNYILPKNPVPLPKEDEALLNWGDGDVPTNSAGRREALSTSARRRAVDTSVTWLKRTVYLTNDPFDPVHQFKSEQQAQADKRLELEKEIARGGQQDRKMLIEESFMHANSRKPLVHSDIKKRHLTAEWVMPVMPDLSLWPNTYTTVAFDKDPAEDDTVKGAEARKRKMTNEALVCNVKRTTFEGSSHEMITGSYLLPKDKRRKGDVGDDDDEGDIQEEEGEGVGYVFAKDYKFNIIHYAQNQFDGNPHLLFMTNPETGEATYCKLSAKVELANLPREQGQPATGRGARVSKRALSEDEITNARKKVSADLQLEGDYDYLPGLVVNEGDFPGEQQEQGIEEAPGQEDDEEEDIRENGHVGGADYDNQGDNEGSRAWNGGASDAERESVLSMTMESEASNVAVKGTESSEADIIGINTDDNDSEP